MFKSKFPSTNSPSIMPTIYRAASATAAAAPPTTHLALPVTIGMPPVETREDFAPVEDAPEAPALVADPVGVAGPEELSFPDFVAVDVPEDFVTDGVLVELPIAPAVRVTCAPPSIAVMSATLVVVELAVVVSASCKATIPVHTPLLDVILQSTPSVSAPVVSLVETIMYLKARDVH
jgi:hypothetical protein